MKKEIVGINHLKEVLILLNRSNNLLNAGNGIFPFIQWKDSINSLIESIEEYIEEESYFGDL